MNMIHEAMVGFINIDQRFASDVVLDIEVDLHDACEDIDEIIERIKRLTQ